MPPPALSPAAVDAPKPLPREQAVADRVLAVQAIVDKALAAGIVF